jgi:hypothetical protein
LKRDEDRKRYKLRYDDNMQANYWELRKLYKILSRLLSEELSGVPLVGSND